MKGAIYTIAGLGLAAGAWALVRAEVARQTQAVLEANTVYMTAVRFGELGIPPAHVLAASMVPLLGMNSPYQAADDILRLGRASRYWPSDYRASSQLGPDGEAAVLALLRVVAERLPR